MKWNRLRDPNALRVGQRLVIGYRKVSNAKLPSAANIIRVPRNATLSHLALRYKTTVKKLMSWNGLTNSKQLRAGMLFILVILDGQFSNFNDTSSYPVSNPHLILHRVRGNPMISKKVTQEKVKNSVYWNNWRECFTDDDLRLVFNPKTYLPAIFDNPTGRENNIHYPYYWIPILAILTGCRLEELCMMRCKDSVGK